MSSGQPQGTLRAHVYSSAPVVEGAFLVGRIDCPELGLEMVAIWLDPRGDRIALQAPCGCMSAAGLSELLMQLAQQRVGHVNPQTH